MSDIEKLDRALELIKENRHIASYFRFLHRFVNSVFYKILLYGTRGIAAAVVISAFLQDMGVLQIWPPTVDPFGLIFIGIGIWFVSWLIGGFRRSYDALTNEEGYEEYIEGMYDCLDRLNVVFWKKSCIKRMKKMLQKENVKDIIDASKVLKPRLDESHRLLNAEKFKKIYEKSVNRQEKVNKKHMRKQQKQRKQYERKQAARGIFGAVLFSWLFGESDGSEYVDSYTPSNNSMPSAPQDNSYKDDSDAKHQEEVRRQRAEFARKADWWEQRYRDLLRDDPKCLNYQTQDAEYNKNYFRRKANGN